MSDTTKSLNDTPADDAEGGVVANSPEATFPEKKSGHKSSHFRGVTLFRPTMKWRAQISAGGKTTSLGDHDTEEEAARAFDRAAINKAGRAARVNFRIEDYLDEVEDLQAMSQTELVTMLRSKARKSGTQTSHYRGVSLLKQTQKWHAQINVGGKQVHLGFFPTEEQAARAYDRAAINKGARDGGKIITNMDITEYEHELDMLRRIAQDELVAALASETRRKQTMEMLASGLIGKAEEVFGHGFDSGTSPVGARGIKEILAKAERAQPKPTQANPLYANFGKKKEYVEGEGPQPPAPRLPELAYTPQRRAPRARRALFQRRPHDFNSSDSSSDEDVDEDIDFDKLVGEQPEQPTRRSARNATKTAKTYNDGSDVDKEEDEEEPGTCGSSPERPPQAKTTPQSRSEKGEWGASSPPFRQRRQRGRAWKADGSEGAVSVHADTRKGGAKDDAHVVIPREDPAPDLIAEAVAAARLAAAAAKPQTIQPTQFFTLHRPCASTMRDESVPGTSGVHTPSELPRINSSGAATAGSHATAGDLLGNGSPQEAADKGSQAVIGAPLGDTASIRAGRFVDPPAIAVRAAQRNLETSVAKQAIRESVTPAPASDMRQEGTAHSVAAVGDDSPVAGGGGSLGEKDSRVVRDTPPRDKDSTLAGLGAPLGDKLSDAGIAVAIAANGHGPSSVKGASPGIKPEGDATEASHAVTNGKRAASRKGGKRRDGLPLQPAQKRARPAINKSAIVAAPVGDGEMEAPASKPLTKRQRAMMERKQGKAPWQAQHSLDSSSGRAEPSPHSSFAANLRLSPGASAVAAKGAKDGLFSNTASKRLRLQEDAASQSSPPVRLDRNTDDEEISSSDESHDDRSVEKRGNSEDLDDLVPRRAGPHRRTRRQPARAAL